MSTFAERFIPQSPSEVLDRRALWEAAKNGMPAPDVDTSAADRMADPSVRRGVPGFLFGDNDPNHLNTGEVIGAALNKGGEALTFGLVGDEASAAVESLLPGVEYGPRRDHYRTQEELLERDHPGIALGSDVGGAIVGAALPVGALPRIASLPLRMGASAAAGAAGAGGYGFMEGEGGADERAKDAMTSALFGGFVGAAAPAVGAVANRLGARRAISKFLKDAPDVDELFTRASDEYADAMATGRPLTGRETEGIATRAIDKLRREGLISPSGTLPSGYTKAKDALAMLMDYGDEAMTPEQMQNVRRTLMEAARQPGNEGRIGAAFVRYFDEVTEPLVPGLKRGNELYARASKGKMFDTMAEEAQRKAGANYTSAGYEHAMRKEFSNLLGRINRGQMDGFRPEEIAAIKRVAEGGPLENFARSIGKYTPSGPMSAFLSAGSGAGIASMFGLNPTILGAGAAGMWGAGTAGRMAATGMQRRNAEIAAALARSGGSLPTPNPATRDLIERLVRRTGVAVQQ